jgi:hypothetical protein
MNGNPDTPSLGSDQAQNATKVNLSCELDSKLCLTSFRKIFQLIAWIMDRLCWLVYSHDVRVYNNMRNDLFDASCCFIYELAKVEGNFYSFPLLKFSKKSKCASKGVLLTTQANKIDKKTRFYALK